MNVQFFIKATISLLLLSLLLVQIVYATTETRYFRSDTANVNGLTTEILGTSQSGVAGTRYKQFADSELAVAAVSLGSQVYVRYDNSTEFKISGASPIAQVTRTSVGSGIMSNNWNCPETSMEENCSVVVRVYTRWRYGTNPRTWWWSAWQLLDTWQTEQLDASQLDSATWTFYYWFQWLNLGGDPVNYRSIFKFDTVTYNSRITNFQYAPVPTAEWHDVAEWNFNLTTRQWLDVSDWNFNVTAMQWNEITEWTFYLVTK